MQTSLCSIKSSLRGVCFSVLFAAARLTLPTAAKTACRLRGDHRGILDSLDRERSRHIPTPWFGCRAGVHRRRVAGGPDIGRRKHRRCGDRWPGGRRCQARWSGYGLYCHSGKPRDRVHGGRAANPAGRGDARQEHRCYPHRHRHGFFHADIFAPKRAGAGPRRHDPADGRFAGNGGRRSRPGKSKAAHSVFRRYCTRGGGFPRPGGLQYSRDTVIRFPPS